MACFRKNVASYWDHIEASRGPDYGIGKAHARLWRLHLLTISYLWTAAWGRGAKTTREGLAVGVRSGLSSKCWRETYKNFESLHLQVACAWRLCPIYQTLRGHWWIFIAVGEWLNYQVFEVVSHLITPSQGELCHRRVKQLYKLTNKHNAAQQIRTKVCRLEHVQTAFHRQKLQEKRYRLRPNKPQNETSRDDHQSDATDDSDLQYFISPSQNEWFDIYALLKSRSADPAYKVSVLSIC